MPTAMKPLIASGPDHIPESFGNGFGKLFPFPVTPRGFGISGISDPASSSVSRWIGGGAK